jgi:hypothetical protein
MPSEKSVICKSSATAKSSVSLTGRRRGRKPAPTVEHPDPLFTDWIEPDAFHESLALHMRRHGDTYWGLWRALVRPDEVFDRTTLQSWTAGRRAPRSAKSFEMLARIEHRYNLPKGHFRSLLPHQTRAVTGHKLVGIDTAEQRRLAWHLPDDFNNRPLRERKEIVDWVRTHIISGSTEYRRFQIEAMKHRYRPPYDNPSISWYEMKAPPATMLGQYGAAGYRSYMDWYGLKFDLVSREIMLKVVLGADCFLDQALPHLPRGAKFYARIHRFGGSVSPEVDCYVLSDRDVMKAYCQAVGHPWPYADDTAGSVWLYGVTFNIETGQIEVVKAYERTQAAA